MSSPLVTNHTFHRTTISFFFNASTTTVIYTLSLHDALPILPLNSISASWAPVRPVESVPNRKKVVFGFQFRSEEHTSELQSPMYLVCRLLLEKKKERKMIFRA